LVERVREVACGSSERPDRPDPLVERVREVACGSSERPDRPAWGHVAALANDVDTRICGTRRVADAPFGRFWKQRVRSGMLATPERVSIKRDLCRTGV